MVLLCCVPGCKSKSGPSKPNSLSFFKFPKYDKKLWKIWEMKVRRSSKCAPLSKHMAVCSNHFLPSDFLISPSIYVNHKYKRLKKGAYPSVFDWNKQVKPRRTIKYHNQTEELEFLPVDNFILDEPVEVFDEEPSSLYTLDECMPESPIEIKREDDFDFMETEEHKKVTDVPVVKKVSEQIETSPQSVESVTHVEMPAFAPIQNDEIGTGRFCGVATCKKTEKDGVALYKVPQGYGCVAALLNGDPCLITLTKAWTSQAQVNIEDKVCSRHFLPEDYSSDKENNKSLKPDAIPSQYLLINNETEAFTPKCSLSTEESTSQSSQPRAYNAQLLLKVTQKAKVPSLSQANQNTTLENMPLISKSDMLTESLQTETNVEPGKHKVEICQGFKDLCRICGLFSMDPMIWLFNESKNNNKVLQKISSFLGITISSNDSNLPMCICRSCSRKLEDCQNFADLAAKTNDNLKLMNSMLLESVQYIIVKKQLRLKKEHLFISKLLPDQHVTYQLTDKDTTATTNSSKENETLSHSDENSYLLQQNLDPLKEKKIKNPAFNKPCSHCAMIFDKESARNNHLKSHHNLIHCKKCNIFIQVQDFQNHREENHMIKCRFCEHFKNEDSFKIHMKITHPELLPKYLSLTSPDEENVKCKLCDYSCGNKRSIKNHYFWSHQLFACDVCIQTFQTTEELDRHIDDVHIIPCAYCKEELFTERRFKRHMSKAHKVQSSKLAREIPKNSKQIFNCQYCKKGITTKFNLKRHNFWSHSKFTCLICLSTFSSLELEEKHFKNHGQMCIWCDIRCNSAEELKEHLQCVHPGQTQIHCCEDCGECFDKRGQLNKHKISHKLNETWLCHICGKFLKTSTMLGTHLNGHKTDDEKQKVCNICNKKFLFECQLKSHMLKHTKEKAYKCFDCDTSFASHKYLEKHMEIHK